MAATWVSIFISLIFIYDATAISTPNSPSYVGAVVEFSPSFHNNSQETLRENTKAYVDYIKKASESNADIIVFPEDALTSYNYPEYGSSNPWSTVVPSVSNNYVPCVQNTIPVSEAVKELSCAAKDYHIYVVVNLVEKCYNDTGCDPAKDIFYNTNVVFDRTGKIIARYRKTHLFAERENSVTPVPEIITFETDFGVTFGVFICFDILFQVPPLTLTRERHITDIVYSAAWFSETPFLTALQEQYGWSYAVDANLLAAGYNNPKRGSTGSGIYLGRKGVAKALITGNTVRELLVAEIPKIKRNAASHQDDHAHSSSNEGKVIPVMRGTTQTQDALKEINIMRQDMLKYQTSPLTESVSKNLCHGDFCCDFKIKVNAMDPNTRYRMVVFNGIRSFRGEANGGTKVCAVIQCANDTFQTCGSAKPSETIFTSIDIAGTISNYQDALPMPSTLSSSLLPLQNWTFTDHAHEDHVHIYMTLNGPVKNVATFGIYSRDFTRDSTNAATTILQPTILNLLMVMYIIRFLF